MQKYKITVYYDMHTPWSGKTSYNLEKEKIIQSDTFSSNEMAYEEAQLMFKELQLMFIMHDIYDCGFKVEQID